MKKIIIAMMLCIISISCKKMLIEQPDDRLYSKDFYKTKEDITAAVNAIYYPFAVHYGDRYTVMYTAITDYGSGNGFIAPFILYAQGALVGTTDLQYKSFYQAVQMANLALKYIPGSNTTDQDKNEAMGEASFLRAFAYRNLVRGWGSVPLKLEPTENLESVGDKRAPIEDIYTQIIKDLQFAETNLPATQALAGKPSKWAAKVMLSDIYLTNEKWDLARDKADEVINSKAYSLVAVSNANDFEKIFGANSFTSSEDVFSIKLSRTISNNLDKFFHATNSTYAPAPYGSIFPNPKSTLIKNWDKNDFRYQYNLYSSYPDVTGKIIQNPAATPLRFGKFKDPAFAPFTGNDMPVYRYPEALLIYAEAASQANNGPTPLALERLNMVRRRAYGYAPDAGSGIDFTMATAPGATAFRELVLKERAYEFMIEDAHRWFDLIRTKTVKQAIKDEKGIVVPDNFLLFPIPNAELDNNPNF